MLDLFCGAGMAADGYTAAGITVELGIDINHQPDYPYPFLKGDALQQCELDRWDFVHASPPCQAHTRAKHLRSAQGGTSKYPDLLTPMLARLRWVAKTVPDFLYCVENVPGAPMEPRDGEWLTTLCGSTFGLGVRRHRLFLTNFPVSQPACRHKEQGRPWGVYHVIGDSIPKGGRTALSVEHGREVMGVDRPIPWSPLKEGFPPAYTEWIGWAALTAHRAQRRAA
jgi:DNA (cytosine-5)-methyltransferase 1